jgi:hypothetical protein
VLTRAFKNARHWKRYEDVAVASGEAKILAVLRAYNTVNKIVKKNRGNVPKTLIASEEQPEVVVRRPVLERQTSRRTTRKTRV